VSRRPRVLLTAGLLASALLASACGGSGGTGGSGSEAGSGAASSPPASSPSNTTAAAFPVTVEHRYGSTTVPEQPKRVVSVGFNDHDTLLALGVTPVGVREWYGEYPSATWPWARDELGSAKPTVLASSELDLEAVAALRPDLIVGIFSGMTREEYGLLSKIAPTVASPSEYPDFGTPWRTVTETYGQALGRSQQAEQVIADVDAKFAEVRKEHPDFDGATASVTFYSSGQLGAYTSADLRSRLLEELGFDVPAAIDQAAGEGAFYAPVSLENADLVDLDALVWITATEAEIDQVRALPVRKTLAAAKEGREVFLPFELNGAMSFSSPLSIPYVLDTLPRELEPAVDGDPATPVPSAQG